MVDPATRRGTGLPPRRGRLPSCRGRRPSTGRSGCCCAAARPGRSRVTVWRTGRTEVPRAVADGAGSSPVAGEESAMPATERELRAELARYQALVEYAPDAIVILDVAAGHFVSVNAAA